MITAGWVTSRPDRDDDRRIQFELSQSGEALIKECWPKAKEFAADIGDLFTDQEFNQFKDMLNRANTSCDARLNSHSGRLDIE